MSFACYTFILPYTLLIKYCKELRFSSNLIENAKLLKSQDNLEFLTELFKLEIQNRELKRKNAGHVLDMLFQ